MRGKTINVYFHDICISFPKYALNLRLFKISETNMKNYILNLNI